MSDEAIVLNYRCDDGAGFEFRVLYKGGDFWLSIVPNADDLVAEHEAEDKVDVINKYGNMYSATVRIRAGMIGGGAHEKLWFTLVDLLRKEGKLAQHPFGDLDDLDIMVMRPRSNGPVVLSIEGQGHLPAPRYVQNLFETIELLERKLKEQSY